MHQISDPRVIQLLDRLHQEAKSQKLVLMKGLAKSLFRGLQPRDMEQAYLAISRSQGEVIFDLLLRQNAQNIVEFGTSFGISTIYMAAAAKQTGGKVITSELLPQKCEVARGHFEEANLGEWIDLREGDALKTLEDAPDGIDFLLLDGWNNLYLPLVQMLEPKFKPGTLIYTDNASFPGSKDFLAYLRSCPENYRDVQSAAGKGDSKLTEVVAA